jgi:hypothetical protein
MANAFKNDKFHEILDMMQCMTAHSVSIELVRERRAQPIRLSPLDSIKETESK